MKKNKIGKLISIVMLSIAGLIGAVVGIFALTGGFREGVVYVNSVFFLDSTFTPANNTGNIINSGQQPDESGNTLEKYIIIENDIYLTMGFLPADATMRMVGTKIIQNNISSPVISLPDRVVAGQRFMIKVEKDDKGRNIGGSVTVEFFAEGSLSRVCRLYIIVDTPLKSIIADEKPVFYNVENLSSIRVPATPESDVRSLYVVAKKEESKTINLFSNYQNAFNINHSAINNFPGYAGREVLFFTDLENRAAITPKLSQVEGKPVWQLALDLKAIQGTQIEVLTRMHRTYQMQQEFNSLGFKEFFNLYYHQPTTISNEDNYTKMVEDYNGFLNKYKNYFIDTRSIEEFFAPFENTDTKLLDLSTNPEDFLAQVWPSLQHVFISADIRFLISDVEINGVKLEMPQPLELQVWEEKTFTMTELMQQFKISASLADGHQTEENIKASESLLTNLNVGVFVMGEEEDSGVKPHQYLQSIYDLPKVNNANPAEMLSLQAEDEEKLNYNTKFLDVWKDEVGNVIFKPMIPSFTDGTNRIYVVFAISIKTADNIERVFYNFGEVFIQYAKADELVYDNLGTISSIVDYDEMMCIDNNQLVSMYENIFPGKVGSQTITIHPNKILNKEEKIKEQYALPRLFVEYNSNTFSAEATTVLLGDEHETRQVYKTGDDDFATFNVIKVQNKLFNFVDMQNQLYTYGDEGNALTAYEIPLQKQADGTFTAEIQALNSSVNSVKFFIAFVLVDENGNAIDREGNQLFNASNQPIDKEGGLLEDEDGNPLLPNLVVLYTSIGDVAFDEEDALASMQMSVHGLLEKINYYTQMQIDKPYLYKEGSQVKSLEGGGSCSLETTATI